MSALSESLIFSISIYLWNRLIMIVIYHIKYHFEKNDENQNNVLNSSKNKIMCKRFPWTIILWSCLSTREGSRVIFYTAFPEYSWRRVLIIQHISCAVLIELLIWIAPGGSYWHRWWNIFVYKIFFLKGIFVPNPKKSNSV